MEHQNISQVIPYAVNSAIVVVILFVVARAPLRKYLYQRHERMKDAFEGSKAVFEKAQSRNEQAKKALSSLAAAQAQVRDQVRADGDAEARALMDKSKAEAQRIEADADRLASAEMEESSNRIKDELVRAVISRAEEGLRKELKNDDHKAIVKNAQNSIEVGV